MAYLHSVPELHGSCTLPYFSGFLRDQPPTSPASCCLGFLSSFCLALPDCGSVPSPSFPNVPASRAVVYDPLLPTLLVEWRAFAAQLRAGNTPHTSCQTARVLNSVTVPHIGHPHWPSSPQTTSSSLLFKELSPFLQATSQVTQIPVSLLFRVL